jgi:zinc protease
MKAQFESAIRQSETDPNDIAGRALDRLLFGDHPYGRPARGSVASMEAITVGDLQGFVKRSFARDRLYVAVVGDITAAQLQPLLDTAFGELPAKGAPVDVPEAKVDSAGGTVIIEQDIPQSIVLFAQDGIKREDPDFFAAYVANFALGGGGFSSRLMNEVREKRGLAYGVSSDLSTYDHAGLIAGGVQTVNAKVAEVIAILKGEWGKMRDEGPTADELETAKTYLLGYYPRNLTTTAAAARTLLGIQLSDLGIDYVTRREREIAAVTLADVKRVAKRLFDPAKLAIVVVGKPEGVVATRPTPIPAPTPQP